MQVRFYSLVCLWFCFMVSIAHAQVSGKATILIVNDRLRISRFFAKSLRMRAITS